MTDTIRCNNCGSYWKVEEHMDYPENWIIKCPNGHYSSFTLEMDIVTDAPLIEEPYYIWKEITKDNILLKLELDWIAKQTADFYDAGFFTQFLSDFDHSPIPQLDLGKIAKPTQSGRIEDEFGNQYRLVISPNGVAYYVKDVIADGSIIPESEPYEA